MTTEDILSALAGLQKPDFDVHTIEDAWYSAYSMARAVGDKNFDRFPKVKVVRVGLKKGILEGILELHPEGDQVNIRCYCCFSRQSPDHGLYSLENLPEAVKSLKDHYCPPWPG